MQEVLNYDFRAGDIRDGDFRALYAERRRDSAFAFVQRADSGETVALRDHLGIVPLYYRLVDGEPRFSTSLDELVEPGDSFDARGIEYFLSFGTAKLVPLVREVGIVPPGTVMRFGPGSATPEVLYEYRLPREPLLSLSLGDLVDEVDRLMKRAVERGLAADTVDLYLSGGIDSALVAIYLKRMGVEVNAYTSSPWGERGTEVQYAKINAARTAVDRHAIVPLRTEDYARYVRDSHRLYGAPHASSTLIGVSSLWHESSIGDAGQLYFGQNTDTMTCSMQQQYYAYFLHRLPGPLKRRLHPALSGSSALAAYLSFSSRGKVTGDEELARVYSGFGPLRMLTLAGMYAVHTPVDGECLSLPAVRRGIPVGNPYYDMDLIEFCLRIPVRHRVAVSRSSKIFVKLEKRVYRRLAERHLPKELVYRKKGFIIPLARDEAARAFAASLPTDFAGVEAIDTGQQLAASVLTSFSREHALIA